MPTKEQVEHWFTHLTAPSPSQSMAFKAVHDGGRTLALLMLDTLPANAEAVTVLLKLQEAVMWANTSISRGAAK